MICSLEYTYIENCLFEKKDLFFLKKKTTVEFKFSTVDVLGVHSQVSQIAILSV